MPVRLDAVVSGVAAVGGLSPDNVAQDKILVVRFINEARRELYELPQRLSALEFSGELTVAANVTAGTCKATQQQAEVTGSGTAWATAMAGSYMKIGTYPWQRVSYVADTTHLTLESAWNNITVTGQSYRLWKRDYQLPPKVARITKLVDFADPRAPLAYYDPDDFHGRYGFGDSFGAPRAWTQFGMSEYSDAFLGSTVYTGITATANSPIVDFSGSALVTALAPGDRLALGNSTTSTAFAVQRVLTDTKIALMTHVAVSLAAQSATAFSMDRLSVRTWLAIDGAGVLYYEALRRYTDLVADNDTLEEGWYAAVVEEAIARVFRYVSDERADGQFQKAAAARRALIVDQYKAHNPAPRMKPLIRERYSLPWGRFGPDRDV